MVRLPGDAATLRLIRSIVWPFLSADRKPLRLFLVSLAAVTATALSHVATPWLIGMFIDAAPRGDVPGLRTAAIGLFLVAVLASAGGGIRMLAGKRLADLFRAHLRMRLMGQVLRLRLSDIEGRDNRELQSVFNDDVAGVANLANPIALNVLLAIIQLAAALGILMTRYSGFAWIVLLAVPINVAIGIWQWPLARTRAREQQKNKTRLDSMTVQIIEGSRDVKGLAVDRTLLNQVGALTAADLLAKWRFYIVGAIEHGRYSITWLIMSTVYFIGGLAVARGELSIGSLTAFIWYVGFLETPISRLWSTSTEWQTARASLERYARVMALTPEPEGPVVLGRGAAPIVELRDVSFTYPESPAPALTGINLRFLPGQQVAIVGASGAGKTTLVSLIPRLFDPEAGAVLIDGTDVRQYTLDTLRKYVAIISQDPFIFDGTVRENISLGLDECRDEDVRQAAEVADADRFIRELPEGYDTVLGARAARLSGGQKRRLAIARAMIRRPRILVLDEVTGALDSVSDTAIQQAINRSGCTTVTVSHRLSSTAHADLIVVLEHGRVVATGTHRSLLRDSAAYRTLAQLQTLQQTFETGVVEEDPASFAAVAHRPAARAVSSATAAH
jgi:ABC-type multidrug transport system fused ATPase/permease subunit